jgi:hypothetical protein
MSHSAQCRHAGVGAAGRGEMPGYDAGVEAGYRALGGRRVSSLPSGGDHRRRDQSRGGDWGIIGSSLRSPDVKDLLAPQDYLYTVNYAAETHRYRVIGVLRDVIVGSADAPSCCWPRWLIRRFM